MKLTPIAHNIALGVGSILIGFIITIPLLLLFGQTPNSALIAQAIGLQIIGMGGVGVAYLYATNKLSVTYVRLKFPSLKDIGWMFGGTVMLFGIAILVTQLARLFDTDGGATHGTIEQVQADPSLVVGAIILGIMAGVFEEFLYRGVMQRILETDYRAIMAILIPNIIFALIHIPAYATQGINANLGISLLVVFSAGMLLGALYYRTKNLAVPIFVHALYNAIVFGVAVF